MSIIPEVEMNKFNEYMKNISEFNNEFSEISRTWDQLVLFSQLSSSSIDITQIKNSFKELTSQLISHLANETLKKVTAEMNSKAQVAVDIVIRNLFERTADVGFLATDEDIRTFLIELAKIEKDLKLHEKDSDDTEFRILAKKLKSKKDKLKERFREYSQKYSVYFDVVLFDNNGKVVARLNDDDKEFISKDEILDLVKSTDEEYVETFKYHDFLPRDDKSLVYSYKVTQTNTSEKILGSISLCFKFENEMKDVFQNLVDKESKETILLLDKNGKSIVSSDSYHIPINVNLDKNLDKAFSITQFAGRDYIIKSCQTNGYEGFYGLGWLGHIMIPLESAFNVKSNDMHINKEVLESILSNENLFKKEILEVPYNASIVQENLDRAVWNGNIQKNEENSDKEEFSKTILKEIKQTGEKTKESFSISIDKLNETIISALLNDVKFLSSLSIDIMDRNLYERANDCRWWALTTDFRKILSKDEVTSEDNNQIRNILKYINSLYTVYTNLFVYDKNGNILAVSNDNETNIVGKKLTQDWFRDCLKITDSSKYRVSKFEPTPLYNNNHTYIYNAAIKDFDNEHTLGGIGIVFNSQEQFKAMLIDSLPSNDDKVKDGYFSIYVEKDTKKIISCSDGSHKIGDIIDIDSKLFKIKNGRSLSKIIEYNNKYYIVGASCSNGYREYKSKDTGRKFISSIDEYKNDVMALVFIEAGNVKNIDKKSSTFNNISYEYNIDKNDNTLDIATFYIGTKWLGIEVSELVGAVSVSELEEPLSTDENHYYKGSLTYKNRLVNVIDISKLIKNINDFEKKDIVLVEYDDGMVKHILGILVDKLGDTLKIPVQYVKPLEEHIIGSGMLAEKIVIPPENSTEKNLLSILNISKINNLKE